MFWIFTLLIKLYPHGFRSEFEDELKVVFAAALKDARGDGCWSAVLVFVREIWDLPYAVLLAHYQEKARIMSSWNTKEKAGLVFVTILMLGGVSLQFMINLLFWTLVMVPWDAAIFRPPPDSWEYALNRFFETWPDELLWATLLIGLQAYLLKGLVNQHRQQKSRVIFEFLVFSLATPVLMMIVFMVTNVFRGTPEATYLTSSLNYNDYRGFRFAMLSAGLFALGYVVWFIRLRQLTIAQGMQANSDLA